MYFQVLYGVTEKPVEVHEEVALNFYFSRNMLRKNFLFRFGPSSKNNISKLGFP